MKFEELKECFPAGGVVTSERIIADVSQIQKTDALIGSAILPPTDTLQTILIHQLLVESKIEYRAVPAKCPHQGADISHDKLHSDGNIYCSVHRRPICVYSEFNNAYPVEKRGDIFYIVKR